MFAILPALFLTVLTLMVGAPVQQEQTLDFKASFESPEGSYEEPFPMAPVMAGDEDLSQAMALGDEVVLEPQSISREQYEAALGVPAAQYTGDTPHTTYQSLEVHWNEFDDFFSTVKLGVSLPEIPGYDQLRESSAYYRRNRLEVSRVLDKAGKNVYDRESSFETLFFTALALNPIDGLPGYVEDEREIHVVKGTKEADLARIDGQVVLELPVNVRSIEFTPREIGQEKTLGGMKVTLDSVEEGQGYEFKYLGRGNRFIKWVGYDAKGEAVRLGSYTADVPDALEEPGHLAAGFYQPVEKVKMFIAEDVLTKTLPFTLELNK